MAKKKKRSVEDILYGGGETDVTDFSTDTNIDDLTTSGEESRSNIRPLEDIIYGKAETPSDEAGDQIKRKSLFDNIGDLVGGAVSGIGRAIVAPFESIDRQVGTPYRKEQEALLKAEEEKRVQDLLKVEQLLQGAQTEADQIVTELSLTPAESQSKEKLARLDVLKRDIVAYQAYVSRPIEDVDFFLEVERARKEIPADYKEPDALGQILEGFKYGLINSQQNFFSTFQLIGKTTGNKDLEKLGRDNVLYFEKELAAHPEWAAPVGLEMDDPATYTRMIGEMVPSTLGFIATTIAGAGAGAVVGGPGGALVGGGAAAFTYGATEEAGQAYKEAKEAGATEEVARNAATVNGLVNGSLNVIPVTKFLSKTPAGTATKKALAKELTKNILVQGGLVGGITGVQQVVRNAVGQTYDENRKLWDGVFESFVVGSLAGGGLGAISSFVAPKSIAAAIKRGERVEPEVKPADPAVVQEVPAEVFGPDGEKIGPLPTQEITPIRPADQAGPVAKTETIAPEVTKTPDETITPKTPEKAPEPEVRSAPEPKPDQIPEEATTFLNQKYGKTFETATKAEVIEAMQDEKLFIPHSEVVSKKISTPSRGLDKDVIKTRPVFLTGAKKEGVLTDGYVLIKDKKIASEIAEDLMAKQLAQDARNLVKRTGLSYTEALKAAKKDLEEAGSKSSFPAYQQIVPKDPGERAYVQGYNALSDAGGVAILSTGKIQAVVDADRLAFIRKYLPEAEMRLTETLKPISFVVGGEVKALLMPIRADAFEIPVKPDYNVPAQATAKGGSEKPKAEAETPQKEASSVFTAEQVAEGKKYGLDLEKVPAQYKDEALQALKFAKDNEKDLNTPGYSDRVRAELDRIKAAKDKKPTEDLPTVRESLDAVKEKSPGELAFKGGRDLKADSPNSNVEIAKAKKRSEMAKELSKKLNVAIRHGKFRKPNAIGIYKVGKEIIRVKSGGIRTIAHEVGHFLDDTISDFNKSKLTPYKKEMEALILYTGYPDGVNKPQEQFGDFVSLYIIQPSKAKEIAPNLFAYFEKVLDGYPEIKDALLTTRDDYARWEAQPASAKVMSQISLDEEKAGLGTVIKRKVHQFYTDALDDLHPLSQFMALAKKEGVQTAIQDNPYVLARLVRGWRGKGDMMLTRGTFGRDYYKVEGKKVTANWTGKSFKEIVAPVEKAGALDDLRIYLVSKRALELAKREKPIETGIDPADARAAIAEMEAKHPEFGTVAQELYVFQDAVVEYGRQSGLYDAEIHTALRQMNKEYVPLYRVMEELAAGGFVGKGFGNLSNQIKRIKGSEREIIDPLEGIVKNTYAIINAAERNQVGLTMAKLASKSPELAKMFEEIPSPMAKVASVSAEELGIDPKLFEAAGGDVDKVFDIFRPSSFVGKDNILYVLDGGKKRFFQVETDLYKALQALNEEELALVIKLASIPAKMLRAGATLSPDFTPRNLVRDQFSAFVYSRGGYLPGVNLIRGIFSLFKKDDAYALWKLTGAERSLIFSIDREYLKKSLVEVLKGKPKVDYVKDPLEILRLISSIGEEGTRIGEFEKVLAKTLNPTEAAFASREVTLDFLRIGAKAKSANSMIAFFNPTLQGLDKMVRELKNRPIQTSTKIFFSITLPSILLYYANRDDARWNEIPQWQKDLFWIYFPDHISKEEWAKLTTEEKAKRLEMTNVWRVPKPFELGILFGSVPERILQYMDEKDPRVFDDLAKAALDGVTPSWLPTGLQPIIENVANYSFFLGRPIVPERIQNLPESAQYTPGTSEVAKRLGEFFNYSPAKIDNLFRGYTAGLGKYVIDGVDGVLKGTGISDDIPEPSARYEDTPVIKAFLVKPPTGSASESVDRFYSTFTDYEKREALAKQYLSSGDKARYSDYASRNPDLLMNWDVSRETYYSQPARYLRKVSDVIGEIRKKQRAVLDARDITPEKKRQVLDQLDVLMTETSKKALDQDFFKTVR